MSDQENRSNPVVSRIDEQLKEIAQRIQRETDEIDSIPAPYHNIELKNQSCQ